MIARTRELRCRELVELVTDYLEGALDPARVVALDAHLAACEGCGTYVEQMRQTVAALRGLDAGGESLSATVRETLLVELRRRSAGG